MTQTTSTTPTTTTTLITTKQQQLKQQDLVFSVKLHFGLTLYPLSLIPYPLSLIPYPLSIIHYPLSLIPYPLSLIPYPLSPIPYPLSRIPYSLSLSFILYLLSVIPYYSLFLIPTSCFLSLNPYTEKVRKFEGFLVVIFIVNVILSNAKEKSTPSPRPKTRFGKNNLPLILFSIVLF